MCGHAEVFCETEWRKFVFQLGWKILWRYLLKPFLITLSPRGSETFWKECFSVAMCFSSLPIVIYCLTHPDSGQLSRPQSLSSFPDSSGDLTGFTVPGSSAAKQVFSFLIDSLFPCYPLSMILISDGSILPCLSRFSHATSFPVPILYAFHTFRPSLQYW